MNVPSARAISCTNCAKRKVRCDKAQPCSHCKRRKNTICSYPVGTHSDSSGQRIKRLEAYIRRLGGDLQLVDADVDNDVDTQETQTADFASSTTPAERKYAQTSFANMVEHDEQVTCIEAPMWYSWSGAKKPERELQGTLPDPVSPEKPHSYKPQCFFALLDPSKADTDSLLALHPPATDGLKLWKQYLKNVHPLTMIFFDWEIELVIQRAAYDQTSLTPGEQALVFSIYFITTLSLSDEQCIDLLNADKAKLLKDYQKAVEESLVIAEFIITSDRLVLQAFMLYLQAMRNRARPSSIHSMMGIVSRIAERMGLHHDGAKLSLSVLRVEERRRMWWQFQHMECDMGLLIGNISMTIYADWDTNLPSNLEDRDLHPTTQSLPPPRHGLTNMSHCLWRYQILHMQRDTRHAGGAKKALSWMLSPSVTLVEKDAMIDLTEQTLGAQFLQYCEPLNPLHVHIQIGVRLLVLAARRMARQPALMNVKISAMSRSEREEFLDICVKCLEYHVLSETTDMLRGYRWHSENYFPWPGLVYVILDAHHRFDTNSVEDLWSLIGKVYVHHPTLIKALSRPDIASIARITLVAWQRRYTHLQQLFQQRGDDSNPEVPQWIQELRQRLALPEVDPASALDTTAREPAVDASLLLPLDFDFDVIDWSFWDNANTDTGACGL